ncbi:hypothetical protein BDW02DRAFT_597930 [Decorospora gaudefroyi]|uniref:Uncharacterized protein n=1 Tax=Decorospora gaudefroyi TaxID=184978 RepID=A0A6A5KGR0_9PLEO|nr:hypothetical protein BDW02DRAFT_597930 [Decorospora gaudefroyi]
MISKSPPEISLRDREVIEIHWPMIIPERASFVVSSSQPLEVFTTWPIKIHALSPVHIWCDRKLKIMPAGPATPGFARGWAKLPNELKLAILRCNLVFPASIWPANVNTVIRTELLPYLRMTPDIAEIARTVFFQENRFIMQFSPSTAAAVSLLARPSISMRPLFRRITVLTRLSSLDWQIIRLMSKPLRAGFTNLVHLRVRCLVWEITEHLIGPSDMPHNRTKELIEQKEQQFRARRGPAIKLPFDGAITFDISGHIPTGIQETDELHWEWMRNLEYLVIESLLFAQR